MRKTLPYEPVPLQMNDAQAWLSQIARATNQLMAGGANTVLPEFTLATGTTTTTLIDSRIGAYTAIILQALNEAAAQEHAWITDQVDGRATVNHTANGTVRKFRIYSPDSVAHQRGWGLRVNILMDGITVLPATPAELIAHWPIVGELLQRAMPVALNRFLAIDILALCITGNAQGWLIREGDEILATMVTRVDIYPRSRGLSIFALAGSRLSEFFEQAQNVLIEYAKRLGLDWLECQGRQGWQRVLNMEPRATFLVLDLKQETPMMNIEGGAIN